MSATLHVRPKSSYWSCSLPSAPPSGRISRLPRRITGLTSTQAKVLAQLDGPLPMRGLAALLVCDASNVTGIVDRLEARGLVRREADTADRRVKNVVATDEGRDTIRRVREEMQATHGALDTLTEDESATLYSLLERLRPAMENRAD